jgi:hypothetical protein
MRIGMMAMMIAAVGLNFCVVVGCSQNFRFLPRLARVADSLFLSLPHDLAVIVSQPLSWSKRVPVRAA